MKRLHEIIATGFYIGKIPFAPGTFGSLLGVVMWLGINYAFFCLECPSILVTIFWIGFLFTLTILGILSSEIHAQNINKEDPGEIVIDEVCGQLLTFVCASIVLDVMNDHLLIFLGFIFFRLFDITKPFIIGIADKNVKGGLGIMLDDLLSGFAAAVLLYAVYVFILS